MMWANDFYEIPDALSSNIELKECVKQLINEKELVGKALEGGNRKQVFRKIMTDLVDGLIDLQESYYKVERQMSESTSMHSGNRRVFSSGWGERLVRTYLSKFYNVFCNHFL